ncbi:hypothetical protein ABTK61_19065, partial [Acinetobacter baumannii]
RYREHLGEIADRIVVGVVHAAQLLLLAIRQLGLLAAQLETRKNREFEADWSDEDCSLCCSAIMSAPSVYFRR